jgi:hypothetical protein
MTTFKSVATEIRNLLSLLLKSELAILVNPVVERRAGARLRVTWQAPLVARRSLLGESFATVSEYAGFVGSQMYSAVLFDGALLQISYDFVGHDIVGHRLCYYPCPFDIQENLLREEPLVDVIDLYRFSDRSQMFLRSPCRFDFDDNNIAEAHPRVHLHIIKGHCRWPVSHPVSIGEFIDFTFRHFYPQVWRVHSFLRNWPQDKVGRRTIERSEERAMHVACPQKPVTSSAQ